MITDEVFERDSSTKSLEIQEGVKDLKHDQILF